MREQRVDRSLMVPETKFGDWFLGTGIWDTRVLAIALEDLKNLIGDRQPLHSIVLDVGCGQGRSFSRLREMFEPDLLIGAEIDEDMLRLAASEAEKPESKASLLFGTSASLAIADESVDMLFCHQTFHHFVDQDSAIREFHRVLKPGGLLLFAESTKAYIESWIIRLLFRHPMDMQKTASEYIALIENAGFEIPASSVSYPYLWWSRSDLGVRENWFRISPPIDREETLINLVAIRA